MIAILLFIVSIAAANIITADTTPADIGPFLVTWGTWVVGVTFVLRDIVQLRVGRAGAYLAVAAGLATAAVTSAILGDTLAVVTASALAFGIGGLVDTEIFTRLPTNLPGRVAASGIVGGLLDTSVFVIVGLSPLWSNIIPWDSVPNAILGVWIAKGLLQLAAALIWRAVRGPEPMPEGAR